ncbi:MAG TPA: alpha-L-fucosidase, partial [Prolixibacteraceae bacterium]|nr:alpha-L-fucosidase [Prolixibacteraceae bacterium]
MKRRELIRSTTALAVTSCLPGWAGAIPAAGSVMEAEQKAQLSNIPRFGDGRDWFFDHRYGMFVHWGLYSIPGWHEQHQWRARVARAEYMKLAEQWNPKKFNPEEWLDLMEEAGMK